MDTLDILKKDIDNIKSITELNTLTESINAMTQKRKNYLLFLNEAKELGEHDFGFIKECFEGVSDKLYATKEGKRIINDYIKTYKNNNSLNNLYSLYENIYHSSSNPDLDYFLNEAFQEKCNPSELQEGVEQIGKLLTEAYILLNGKMNMKPRLSNSNLNEAINYLAVNKQTNKNISEYSSNRNVIRDYLKENAGKNTRIVPTATNLDSIVESFSTKFKDSASADIIKEVANAKDKEAVFNKYKQMCLEKLDKTINENTNDVNVDRLTEIKTQLTKKTFTENTLGKDVANFIELTETL